MTVMIVATIMTTSMYLYGVGRIAQQDAVGTEYFLADALGSVRQLADASGAVTLGKTYKPYGEVLASTGGGTSAYGFTGEITDANGLVHLRARYYAPGQGRFVTKDPSQLETNSYLYAEANPINRLDPSGLFSSEIVAHNFGKSTINEVISDFANSAIFDTNHKYAWLATLLTANDGDQVRVGYLNLQKLNPKEVYSGWKKVWLTSCDQIMIGNHTLSQYTDDVVKYFHPPNRSGNRHGGIPWRDNSTSYYQLASKW